METPILCLKDMLYQMKEQLTVAEQPRTFSNNKQKITVAKAQANLKRVIAELEQAIKILEEASGEARTDSNNEQAKEVCPNCSSNDVTELIKNDFYCYTCNYSWTN